MTTKIIQNVKSVLSKLPASEARRVLLTVFGELLANPFLSDFERAHLESRRAELLDAIDGEGVRKVA